MFLEPKKIERYTPGMRSLLRAALVLSGAASVAYSQGIPERLSDTELWHLSGAFSEANGYFRSDNFVSNETGFQYVIPALKRRIAPGSVYLGVGPEQNFTYVAALQPKIAFIIDIRRGNLIAQLMYKALFETSADRAEFLSKLFSRPRPMGLDTTSSAQQLFGAYTAAKPDSALFRRNLAAVKDYLTRTHGWVMSDSDSKLMDYTYGGFFGGGPQITYNFPSQRFGGYAGRGMPTYATLQEATDESGKNWAFLANEAAFRWMKDFESRNLVVPIVADFAGPKAIREVAQYLRDHHAIVGAFYTSNVEQYLFQDGVSEKWYRNAATLPVDSSSTFIRSIGGAMFGNPYNPVSTATMNRLGGRLPSVTSSIEVLLKAFNDGKIVSYGDVIALSR
jgi:hypothetical protein